jgi:hypothetical protein
MAQLFSATATPPWSKNFIPTASAPPRSMTALTTREIDRSLRRLHRAGASSINGVERRARVGRSGT